MSSNNNSTRPPPGCVSIPVEIIREPSTNTSNSHSRHNSPFRGLPNDNTYSGFSGPSSWISNSPGYFTRPNNSNPVFERINPNPPYDPRLYDNPLQRPLQEPTRSFIRPRLHEMGPFYASRSSEDLLSSPNNETPQFISDGYSSLIPPRSDPKLQTNSDFVQPNRNSIPVRRSYDALNDYTDAQQNFPTHRWQPFEQRQQQPVYRSTFETQHQPHSQQQQQQQQQQQPNPPNQHFNNPNIIYLDEYGTPIDQHQSNISQATMNNNRNDCARSPASQRGTSPAKTPASTTQQQESEPELKMAKDIEGPIPMPAPSSSSSSSSMTQSTDPLTCSGDTSTSATNIPPPTSQPLRDSDILALEQLEELRVTLDNIETQVETLTCASRADRTYKTLDEQALKIMIRCDELVDVGPEIKEKRKEMIQNVQRVLTKLEKKVPATPIVEQNSNPMEILIASDNQLVVNNDNTNTDNENTGEATVSTTSPPTEDLSGQVQATEKTMST